MSYLKRTGPALKHREVPKYYDQDIATSRKYFQLNKEGIVKYYWGTRLSATFSDGRGLVKLKLYHFTSASQNILVFVIIVCDVLRELVPLVQFKNYEKHP